jgi:hypothetical protein
MPPAAQVSKHPLFNLCELLNKSAGCTGGCVYTWNGTEYIYKSGSCTGGTGCPSCPGSFGSTVRSQVLRLRSFFPNPDDVMLNCSLITQVETVLAELIKIVEAAEHTFYKTLSAVLGGLSLLLLAGLIYALLFR